MDHTYGKEDHKTAGGRKLESALRLPEFAPNPTTPSRNMSCKPLLETKAPPVWHGVEPHLDCLNTWTAHSIKSGGSNTSWFLPTMEQKFTWLVRQRAFSRH